MIHKISLLVHRIFLFRPLLARLYSMRCSASDRSDEPPSSNLQYRITKECAVSCVEAAKKLVKMVIDTLDVNQPVGLFPWWYRIYYLHIAGTNFLAAMFRSDLFTESVSQSWEDLMVGLRAHEHLSAYVKKCIRTFDSLSIRIQQTRNFATENLCDIPFNIQVENHDANGIFQDLGFNFDDFIFGNTFLAGDSLAAEQAPVTL